jgi:hypothetical protein
MNSDSTNDQIARRAYELWERDGRPEGKATDHWLQAEAMIRSPHTTTAERNGTVETPKTRRPPSAKPASRKRDKSFEMVS